MKSILFSVHRYARLRQRTFAGWYNWKRAAELKERRRQRQ